jgi:glycosyltransferase involved in cell wall biosynthesis
MVKRQTISCILPCYNEGERMITVLDELAKVKNLAEIIVVDDCSIEDDSLRLKKLYPTLKLLRLMANQGKSGAVKAGLELATSDYVFLCDADLKDLKYGEIESAIEVILANPKIDMLILRRVRAPWFVKINRSDILFSGERILRSNDLIQIFKTRVSGWQLEAVINKWMMNQDKIVYWFPHSAINPLKVYKFDLAEALYHYLKMHSEIFKFGGVSWLFKQMIFFARKPIPRNR